MKRNSILLCLLFTIAANLFTTAKAQVNTTDSLALVDLYNSTDGPHWRTHINWLTTAPVSTWSGVIVTGTRVTSLSLYDNSMAGFLPASIGNLINLETLFLSFNYSLIGSIPASIGNLINLTNLDLSDNSLSGSIPSEIGNLIKLKNLDLIDNLYLNGFIPASIGNLVSLDNLNFGFNQLSGAIPAEIGKLANLRIIELSYNQLSGAIPAEIGNMVNLQSLYLNNNQLSGAISTTLQKLKSLTVINLAFNKLSQFNEYQSSATKSSVTGYIGYNLFTFNGLQVIAKKYPNIKYAPQDTILPIHRAGNHLSVNAGGRLSNNTYNWYKKGTAASTVITGDSTFIPSQSGKYYVKVTNKVANQLTLYSDTVNFVMTAKKQNNTLIAKATQPATIISHMQVYPNPAKDIIHIQANGAANITLTSSNGKVLLTKIINNSDVINVSKYANGIYYIQNKTTGEAGKVTVVH